MQKLSELKRFKYWLNFIMKKHTKNYLKHYGIAEDEVIAKNMKEWHKLVCERDGYICQVCNSCFNYDHYFNGEVNSHVCGHHLKRKGADPSSKLVVSNGICVCNTPSKANLDEGCHNMLHSKGNILIKKNEDLH